MADTNESKTRSKSIEEDEFIEDETIAERLIGLTEMFPEPVRNVLQSTGSFVMSASKSGFWLMRNALWIASSSAVILALPVIFESERAQQQEEQLQQQRQILLGPNAAVSGSGGSNNLLPGMGMVPPPHMSSR